MRTEEIILIPKRMFASHQPVKKEVLENPLYKQKSTQLCKETSPTQWKNQRKHLNQLRLQTN